MLAAFPGLATSPSAWTVDIAAGAPDGRTPMGHCQLCGDPRPVGLGWHHISGDHDDWSPDNLAVACVLCHSTQHLNRPTIRNEVLLIWAPDLLQPEVIAVARAIHGIFLAAKESPALGHTPRKDEPKLRAAWRTYRALADRAGNARRIAGTDDPQMLGAALIGMRKPSPALSGVRLLPAGRHFRAGLDIYPELLKAAATP